MKKEELQKLIPDTFQGFEGSQVPKNIKLFKGKVRDVFDLGPELIISTTDRISAFDRVLSTIPCKGEVLNRISLYWFKETAHIIQNHIIDEVSPRTVRVKKCEILPVEIIVRGYLTGSAWRDYNKTCIVSGIKLPAGMKMDQAFEKPLITPSTKAEKGHHDEPISCEEIVKSGLVDEKIWRQVEEKAIALFNHGKEIAKRRGLVLVDTKYEFGVLNGKVILADEIHTPDSSRFWYSDTYDELFKKGESQRKVDKEYLREWLMARGFMGDGESPEIPDDVRVEVASRYITAFELITGEKFSPKAGDNESEKKKILSLIK